MIGTIRILGLALAVGVLAMIGILGVRLHGTPRVLQAILFCAQAGNVAWQIVMLFSRK